MYNVIKIFFIGQKQWLYVLLACSLLVLGFVFPFGSLESTRFSEELVALESQLEEQNQLTVNLSENFSKVYELERKEGVVVSFSKKERDYLLLLEEKFAVLEEVNTQLPTGSATVNLTALETEIRLYRYSVEHGILLLSQGKLLSVVMPFVNLIYYNIVSSVFLIFLILHLDYRKNHRTVVEKLFIDWKNRTAYTIATAIYIYAFSTAFHLLFLVIYGQIQGGNPFELPISYHVNGGYQVTSIGTFLIYLCLIQPISICILAQLIRLMSSLHFDVVLIFLVIGSSWLPLFFGSGLANYLPLYHLQSFSVFGLDNEGGWIVRYVIIATLGIILLTALLKISRKKNQLTFLYIDFFSF